MVLPKSLFGQYYFRVKADFSIKEKDVNGTQQLVMGKVYFDKNSGKLIYDIAFPERETWVIQDTMLYKFDQAKTLIEKKGVPNITEHSFFNLVLNNQLKTFGLEDQQNYSISDVEMADDLVITTWSPGAAINKIFGDVVIAQRQKRLSGLVIKNAAGDIVSKQSFENYEMIAGLQIPTELTQVNFVDGGGKTYKVTEFKSIVVDDLEEDAMYDHLLPR